MDKQWINLESSDVNLLGRFVPSRGSLNARRRKRAYTCPCIENIQAVALTQPGCHEGGSFHRRQELAKVCSARGIQKKRSFPAIVVNTFVKCRCLCNGAIFA